MSTNKMQSVFNIVLLALQICLGVWQFTKLTPVGALIQGVMGWLLRPFRLSSTYVQLQCCNGRVFKKVNSYMLQADIQSETTGIHTDVVNIIQLNYLGEESRLEIKRGNMLFVNGKMCYYITDRIWEELHTMRVVLERDLTANSYAARATKAARAAATAVRADAIRAAATAAAERAAAAATAAAADRAAAATAAAAAAADHPDPRLENAAAAARSAAAGSRFAAEAAACSAAFAADRAADADRAAAADLAAAAVRASTANYSAALNPVFMKSRKYFWADVIMGGMMRLDEVLDGVILQNQCLSLPIKNHPLLPVDVLVSEEKLLKILNLFALFLQTKRVKVNWLIPTASSILSALLEFSTTSRVWLYTCINVGFCDIVHFICDPLPRSWRQQVYFLGIWVENLKPCNDIELKVVRGDITAIITEGAKVDKEGATLVPWLDVANGQIEKHFLCMPTDGNIHIRCTYVRDDQICEISAPTISDVYVDCKSMDDFKHIVTLVSCIADNCCGSLISYGPKNKVRVRGFKESLISYVKNGLPPIYQLKLENVVVA